MFDNESQKPSMAVFSRIGQFYQSKLDKSTPHVKSRWTFAIFLVILFLVRVIVTQGWYMVTYGLGIYHLSLFIAFLTPQIDPELADNDGPSLPTSNKEEYRPFIRRLPEFKFWLAVQKSTLFAFATTLFESLNIPVFWPILLFYFIALFCHTMQRQIKHMIKHKYLPFSSKKPRYQDTPN